MNAIEYPIVKILWLLTPKEKRKPWDEVVSGSKKHVHKYTIPHTEVYKIKVDKLNQK